MTPPIDGPAFPHGTDTRFLDNVAHGLTKRQWYASCWLIGAYADPVLRALPPAQLAARAAACADAVLDVIS